MCIRDRINTAIDADGEPSTEVAAAAMRQAGSSLNKAEALAAASVMVARSVKVLKTELISMVTGRGFNMAHIGPVIEEIARADPETSSLYVQVSRLKQKDETSFQHSLSVGILMGKLGDALDLDMDTIEMLVLAGMLHDVGKLTISKDILQKQGPLTVPERKLIQSHPRRGHQILTKYPGIPAEVLEICLHHHELIDGSGYPSGKAGDEIGLLVRISTVCDVFDALTSVRPYKRGWSVSEALSWMFERDQHFDRKLVLRLGASIHA